MIVYNLNTVIFTSFYTLFTSINFNLKIPTKKSRRIIAQTYRSTNACMKWTNNNKNRTRYKLIGQLKKIDMLCDQHTYYSAWKILFVKPETHFCGKRVCEWICVYMFLGEPPSQKLLCLVKSVITWNRWIYEIYTPQRNNKPVTWNALSIYISIFIYIFVQW